MKQLTCNCYCNQAIAYDENGNEINYDKYKEIHKYNNTRNNDKINIYCSNGVKLYICLKNKFEIHHYPYKVEICSIENNIIENIKSIENSNINDIKNNNIDTYRYNLYYNIITKIINDYYINYNIYILKEKLDNLKNLIINNNNNIYMLKFKIYCDEAAKYNTFPITLFNIFYLYFNNFTYFCIDKNNLILTHLLNNNIDIPINIISNEYIINSEIDTNNIYYILGNLLLLLYVNRNDVNNKIKQFVQKYI